jgi:hypothetical protein
MTKETAWVIFRADKLGQPEAKAAIDALTEDEWNSYQSHTEEFDYKLAQIGIEAQNEAHPEMQIAESKSAYLWVAEDYRKVVTVFEGSKYEKLHLSALFGIANNELLLELVKP